MASHELIDAQFNRAVEIVQGLPKTGPIQTDYEEKLQMYSLFKQATVGNVQPPRPGIWDMLGRAKWDAWANHKDLDSIEAKWFYVDALLKVLKRYSDKTVARDLVQELESYGGDPSNLVLSRSFSKSRSETSGSSDYDDDQVGVPASNFHAGHSPGEEAGSEEEMTTDDDEARELPPPRTPLYPDTRPRSAHSAQSAFRYRTPAGSLLMSPPPTNPRIPQSQPLPGFETASAYAAPTHPTAPYPHPASVAGTYQDLARDRDSPQNAYPYRGVTSYPSRPASRPTLEGAIENVQAHLAALTERIESLETRVIARSFSGNSPKGGSPRWFGGRGSPHSAGDGPQWDIEDLGLWSTIFVPLQRALLYIRGLGTFFARDENRSPAKMVVRRLCLDISFFMAVVAVMGWLWRRSGVRRQEVRAALIILWQALLGTKPRRKVATKAT